MSSPKRRKSAESTDGAKVNHRMVNIDHPLHSGDQVEILTASKVHPREEWLEYVTSPQARRHIRNYLNNNRVKLIQQGRNILEAHLHREGYALGDLIPNFGAVLNYPSSDHLYLAVQSGDEMVDDGLVKRLIEFKDSRASEDRQLWLDSDETQVPKVAKEERKKLYLLEARDGRRNYIRSQCCKPIFGEEVDGILNQNEQVEVHQKSCPVAMRLKATYGDRIIAVAWGPHIHSNFGTTLEIEGVNQDGFVYSILGTIRDLRVPLIQIGFSSSIDRAIGKVKIRIPNITELNYLIRRIKDENDIIHIRVITN